jgi:hypothetical protein
MARPSTTQLPCNEADIVLALKRRQIISINLSAATYNVPESTLRDRLARKAARCGFQPNSRKLTNPKEGAIIKHVLVLDSHGFLPSLNDVQYMANKLLAKRSAHALATELC